MYKLKFYDQLLQVDLHGDVYYQLRTLLLDNIWMFNYEQVYEIINYLDTMHKKYSDSDSYNTFIYASTLNLIGKLT